MGHVLLHVMHIYIFNELMHPSPFINNAGPANAFHRVPLIRYHRFLLFFFSFFRSNRRAETWDGAKKWKRSKGGKKNTRREFISQTVTYCRSFLKGLINVIHLPIREGTIFKQHCFNPIRGAGNGNSTKVSCSSGLWYLSILCFTPSTRAHTFTHSHAAVRHILMALLWPEHAWSGLGRGRDPGLTATHQSHRDGKNQRDCKEKRKTKNTHAHWRNSRSCWVTGVETEKMGIISLYFFFNPLFPLKRNSSLCLPPAHTFENIPFPSTFPSPQFKILTSFAPLASPLLSSSISCSQLGACLQSQVLSLLAIYITWLQNAFAQFSNYGIMPRSFGSFCLFHFLPFTQTALHV